MDDLELQVQKNVISFCKFLPVHVETWKSIIQQSAGKMRNILNYSEQLVCIQDADLDHLDNFEDVQKTLKARILDSAEEDLEELKHLLDQLHKTNNDLKNKLFSLEKLSHELDWEEDLIVIKGTGCQPPLGRILQDGLNFFSFFSKICRDISENFKNLDLDKENSVKSLEVALCPSLENEIVCDLLAVTQYIDDEKNVP